MNLCKTCAHLIAHEHETKVINRITGKPEKAVSLKCGALNLPAPSYCAVCRYFSPKPDKEEDP